jgi:hypothetical protein
VEGIQNPVEQVFAMVLSKEDCSYCRGEEGEMALFKQLQMAGKLKEVGKLSVPGLGRRRRARRERVEGEKESVEKNSIENVSVSIQDYVPIISPPDLGFTFALVF